MYYVYSLKCKEGYYTGCTDKLDERLEKHKKGKVISTRDRLPLRLAFYFATDDKYVAYKFEKYLKSGSGRAFIQKHFK